MAIGNKKEFIIFPNEKNINTESKIIFRANHGSNAYNIAGTFPHEKKEMLEKVGWLAKHPENVRPQGLRGF